MTGKLLFTMLVMVAGIPKNASLTSIPGTLPAEVLNQQPIIVTASVMILKIIN